MNTRNTCMAPGCNNTTRRRGSGFLLYCSEECRGNLSKTCPGCGNIFKRDPSHDSISKFRARKYCSIDCTNAAKKLSFSRKCVGCKTDFVCSSRVQRLCSPSCASRFGDHFFKDMAMSQEEVAKRLGISQKAVQYHEQKALTKLAEAAAASPILREFFNRNLQ